MVNPFPDYAPNDERNEPFASERRRANLVLWMMATASAAAFIGALTVGAFAHDWYPLSCCWSPSNAPAGILGDCSEIPTHAVREGPNGYEVTLRPGEHPQVDRPVSFTFPYADAQVSPDGLYYVCLRKTLEPRCFFAGARGS